MARYEVRSLDVWGNAVDGYEVNNLFRDGEVRFPDEASDEQIIQALIDQGHLRPEAMQAFEDGEVAIEDPGLGEFLEITERDTAWAGVPESDMAGEEPRYLGADTLAQAEAALEEGERAEEVENMRPLFQLALIEEPEWLLFMRWVTQAPSAVLKDETRPVGVEFYVQLPIEAKDHNRIPIEVTIENFSFESLTLGDLADSRIGRTRDGHVVNGSQELLEQAKVALDAFLERGGEISPSFDTELPKVKLPRGARKFIAQRFGPQSGYAYVIDLDAVEGGTLRNWNEAQHQDSWQTRVVGREQFGAEVGVVVIYGDEMRVWEMAKDY